MRALVQRVSRASVTVDSLVVGEIQRGLLILLGMTHTDTDAESEQLARKVVQLRIFPDGDSKMNLSVRDIQGELLVVSQFTLYGDAQKGNRPSYADAAPAHVAEPLYQHFVQRCKEHGLGVKTGRFQAHMYVESVNDGPVTILCEVNSK